MREYEEQLETLGKLLALWQSGSQAVAVEASEFIGKIKMVLKFFCYVHTYCLPLYLAIILMFLFCR